MARLIGKKYKLLTSLGEVSVTIESVCDSGFVSAKDFYGRTHIAHYLELMV